MNRDLFERMEQAVRRFGGDLPIDSLLPELDPEARDRTSKAEAPGPRTSRAEAEPESPTASRWPSLDDEVRDFLSRDAPGVHEDDREFTESLKRGIDPNVD